MEKSEKWIREELNEMFPKAQKEAWEQAYTKKYGEESVANLNMQSQLLNEVLCSSMDSMLSGNEQIDMSDHNNMLSTFLGTSKQTD